MNWTPLLEKDWRWSAKLRLRQERGWLRTLAVFFAHSGDSWFWLPALALVWLLASGHWHTTAAMMLIAIAVMVGVVMVVKLLVRRPRPSGEWGQIYRKTDPHSFPSGHAARAVLLAVMACGLGPSWFAVIMLVWAPLVSLSRVAMGVHYLSDILAGMLIGLVVGLAVLAVQPWLVTLLGFLFRPIF